jgi:hypothetical protein
MLSRPMAEAPAAILPKNSRRGEDAFLLFMIFILSEIRNSKIQKKSIF